MRLLREWGLFGFCLLLTVLVFLALMTGCATYADAKPRNTVKVTSYALDASGNLQPNEQTELEGVWENGRTAFTMGRVYEASADGTAQIKVGEFIEVLRDDDATVAGEVAKVRAKEATETTEILATTAGTLGVSAVAASATAGGSTALPAIIEAMGGLRNARRTTETASSAETTGGGEPGAPAEAASAAEAGDVFFPEEAEGPWAGDEGTTVTVPADLWGPSPEAMEQEGR